MSRTAVLQRLSDPDARLVSVVAPIGYGKTKAIAEFARERGGPVVWLTVADDCRDLIVLARYLATALDMWCPLGDDLRSELDAAHPRPVVVSAGLSAAIGAGADRLLIVVDDVQELTDAGLALIDAMVEKAPPGAQVALVGTSAAPFIGRDRAAGGVVELGPEDLAFDVEETALLIRSVSGSDVDPGEAATIRERTEGWAAGLYLAALALGRGDADVEIEGFPLGSDRYITDFLRQTVLSRLSSEQVDFLLQTSVLHELSGPVCDAVLETDRSAARLEELDDANLFVVPLDHHRERYRYHGLFRECLRSELAHRSASLEAFLHARASAWYESQGSPERAIEHAMAASDVDRVATLLRSSARALYVTGRVNAVLRSLEWFDAHARIEEHPQVAVTMTWTMLMDGRTTETARWAAAVAAASAVQPLDPYLEGVWLLARAAMTLDGLDAMADDAEAGSAALPAGDQWIPTSWAVRGLVSVMRGDEEGVSRTFRTCLDHAAETQAPAGAVIASTQLALAALHRGDVAGAGTEITRSRQLLDEGRLHGYPFSALTLAVSARVALLQGDHERAERFAREADALRDRLNVTLPSVALQSRIELARVAIALGDVRAAQMYLSEADEIVAERPGLGILVDELREVEREFEAQIAAGPLVRPLTPAERRLLPFLTTHLSFAEIAERLFVSPHTVKTQAISLYRKLGVSSRGAAVEEARRLGLLTP